MALACDARRLAAPAPLPPTTLTPPPKETVNCGCAMRRHGAHQALAGTATAGTSPAHQSLRKKSCCCSPQVAALAAHGCYANSAMPAEMLLLVSRLLRHAVQRPSDTPSTLSELSGMQGVCMHNQPHTSLALLKQAESLHMYAKQHHTKESHGNCPPPSQKVLAQPFSPPLKAFA